MKPAAVIIAIIVVIAAIGCSKSADIPTVKLGEVPLAADTPLHLDAGPRKECVFTATAVTNDAFHLVISITSRNFSGVIDSSETKHLNLHFGRKCSTVVDDVPLEFTPILKTE